MSTPTPPYGAPSLGPADRISATPPRPDYGLGWDDYTPAAWRAFGEPDDPSKEE